MEPTMRKIRFIGYAIPTTPSNLVSIGDPNGPGAVAGTYLGYHDPHSNPEKIIQNDIQGRIDIVKNAVDTARENLPDEDGVINVFVAPEFYFHGTRGPYIFPDPRFDPIHIVKEKVARTFTPKDYPHWIFVFGSVVTSLMKNQDTILTSDSTTTRNKIVKCMSEQWLEAYGPLKDVIFDMLVNFIKVCHSYPCCEVRNRSVILSNIPIYPPLNKVDSTLPNIMTTEKYFVSNEDFVLYDPLDPGGKETVTEQMTAYPPIDLSAGDVKKTVFDEYAIFSQVLFGENPVNPVINYGIEICLDHSDTRLRRNIDNEPGIGGIHVQIIPSCGMQIICPSVAAEHNGFVFNCDGQYPLNKEDKGKSIFNGVNCLYANYKSGKNYAAHTQLARVEKEAKGGNPNSRYSSNATFKELDPANIDVISVRSPKKVNLDEYFAGGPGELHIYGLKSPYAAYP